MSDVTWVLESDVFPETHTPLRNAIRDRGHRLVEWSDSWWTDGVPSRIPRSPVFFHGSLGNAARIADQLQWSPGSFCPVRAFHCSAWYDAARRWLVHVDWVILPANEVVAKASQIAARFGSKDRLFVRPDSPLEPFSGRVVDPSTLTLAGLDHGFYYDDEALPIVVAPARNIGDEWRFVIVRRQVVTGSAYEPNTRKPIAASLGTDAASFAARVASELPPPSEVYVLDVCECDGELRLLELNPFGGADLYACNALAIVDAVSAIGAAA